MMDEMITKEFKVIPVTQPIGTFYLTAMRVEELQSYVRSVSRKDSEKAFQREVSRKRISEIADYCNDPDATFPTAIIISLNDNVIFDIKDNVMTLTFFDYFGDVIDGQHRLRGISKNNENARFFSLPVVIMTNMTLEEKAYVFSIINSKQEQVDKNLIYDLFEISKERSPQKTAHEVARILNRANESPFKGRLKMLGKKEIGQHNAIISQRSFVDRLLNLISNNPDSDRINIKNGYTIEPDSSLPFRQFFIDGEDEIIVKILLNCFNGLKAEFPEEWNHPDDNILWRTSGFSAIMEALPRIIEKGSKKQSLDKTFFKSIFRIFKHRLSINNKTLKVGRVNPINATELRDLIIECVG